MNIEELYVSRILVFAETEPQSNKYRQVILNPEQFKKMSDAIIVEVVREKDEKGYELIQMNESEEIYTLPDLPDINYSKEQPPKEL